jgi:nucleotide-binding universal stress UspA family protein
MYNNILVTLDGSAASERVLSEVAKLDGQHIVKVTLLSVAEEPEATAEVPHPLFTAGAAAAGGVVTVPPPRTIEDRGRAFQRMRETLNSYLRVKTRELKGIGCEIATEVRFGRPVEEILAEAREKHADLIMMATHGRTALAQVVFGSVAAGVLRSGVAPVLLVRPERLREKGES